jgi:four helix bundle protein
MFSHDKLKVYQKALASVARLANHSVLWDKRHSVVDQLLRASESIVLNIAEGARLRGGGNKPEGDRRRFLDIAQGSAVKAAAYLDLCERNAELEPVQRQRGADLLGRIALMTGVMSRG